MEQEHCAVAHQIAGEQDDLAIDDEGEAGAGQADGRPETVAVDDGVDERGEQNPDDLERLRELQPEEGDADGDGVAEQLEVRDFPVAEEGDEGADGVEEAGEVEGVGPKEDAAGGAGAQREAEEPLERGGAGAAPQPAAVLDLGGGGEEGAGEDGGGDDGHAEGVGGGEGAEGEGAAVAEEEEEEDVEEESGGDVEDDGGEEEGPGGAPQLGVAPPEADDGGMLREVIPQAMKRRHFYIKDGVGNTTALLVPTQ